MYLVIIGLRGTFSIECSCSLQLKDICHPTCKTLRTLPPPPSYKTLKETLSYIIFTEYTDHALQGGIQDFMLGGKGNPYLSCPFHPTLNNGVFYCLSQINFELDWKPWELGLVKINLFATTRLGQVEVN